MTKPRKIGSRARTKQALERVRRWARTEFLAGSAERMQTFEQLKAQESRRWVRV